MHAAPWYPTFTGVWGETEKEELKINITYSVKSVAAEA